MVRVTDIQHDKIYIYLVTKYLLECISNFRKHYQVCYIFNAGIPISYFHRKRLMKWIPKVFEYFLQVYEQCF